MMAHGYLYVSVIGKRVNWFLLDRQYPIVVRIPATVAVIRFSIYQLVVFIKILLNIDRTYIDRCQ